MLDKEARDLNRGVLEAVHIKLKGVTLNCNYGYDLHLLREEIGGGGGGIPLAIALRSLEALTFLGSMRHSWLMT